MSHAATILKATPHMYRGYHSETAPVLRDNHDPAQWREQRSRSEYIDEMPLQSICGWQQRKFLGDLEDKKII